MSLEKVIDKKNNDLSKRIDKQKVPEHVAIIMDGNGRWATKKGLPRSFGHKQGVPNETLRHLIFHKIAQNPFQLAIDQKVPLDLVPRKVLSATFQSTRSNTHIVSKFLLSLQSPAELHYRRLESY